MLHYLVETRGDRLRWHDVEALPLYAAAAIVTIFMGHLLASVLPPGLLPVLAKAVAIVALLGIRNVATREPVGRGA